MHRGIAILVCCSLLIAVFLRWFGIIEFNIVKVKYPDIMTVMYDRDWHGSPYNIREVSSYRWFEDGMVSINPNKKEAFQQIVNEFPNMRLDVSMFGQERIIAHDAIVEVCIEEVKREIVLVDSGILKDKFEVIVDADLQIFNGYREPNVYDYAIKFTAPVEITGLKSDYYVNQSIDEFCLYRILHLLDDYFHPS